MIRHSIEELSGRIKSLAGASTADLVGIAPGEAFSTEELGDLGAQFGPVRSVVVLAHHLVDPVQTVRLYLADRYQDSRIATSFGDAMLRDAAWRAVEILRDAGHRAAMTRNQRYGADDPRHHISYKKAGVLAGLGAFGKNQLLIHPEWGPWMWLSAVLTDAPLSPDTPIDFSPCIDCARCIEACPKGALSESGFDRAACESRDKAGGRTLGVMRISPLGQLNCDECMRACPVGSAPPRFGEEVGSP
jgi:epoxyqueuosine reductase